MSSAEIFLAEDEHQIDACFEVFLALRPHLEREGFLAQVRRQQAQGYRILALREFGMVRCAAGFRLCEFLAWGRVLYIDDLSTLPEQRGKGYASQLLDWIVRHAEQEHCAAVHLDSGYGRHNAHRLYLSKGFVLSSHHFAKPLPGV